MVVDGTTTSPEADYVAIFEGYVLQSVRRLLARVRRSGAALPDADQRQAQHTLSYALKFPVAWPEVRALLLAIAPKMEQAGQRDDWIPFLEQGLRQSQARGDAEAAAELELQLGILRWLQGKYDSARSHLRASANSFAGLHAPHDQARALNRLAYVARLQRRFEAAAQLAEKARRLAGDDASEQAYSAMVLGLVQLDRRNWPAAIARLQQALHLWEGRNDRRMIGLCLVNLGAALRPLKRYEEATELYRRALDVFEEINDPVNHALTQMNLGNVLLSRDRPAEAVSLYLASERVFHRLQDRLRLAQLYHNTGLCYRRLQQWPQAEEAYLSSIEHYQALGNVALLVEPMDGLGLVYLALGRQAAARETFEAALDQLEQIEGQPGYQRLFEMLTAHLQQVS